MDKPRTDTGFPCSGCGACCRVAGLWGHPTLDGLKCVFLDEGNRCMIYAIRPDVCRFGTKKPEGQSMKDYALDVAAGCDALQEREGADPSLRVLPRLRRLLQVL